MGKTKSAATAVNNVAAYILERRHEMTAMKLQKLVYYSQAWSLVWDERPLFPERIEAWANGPVVPDLYFQHRGQFIVSTWNTGDAGALDVDARETVDAVLEHYGDLTAAQLSDLTHREDPWRRARKGLSDGERSNVQITLASMHEYYHALDD